MRMRFRTFVGMYVFHCHIANHEDEGMMAVVNVS
jgi:FtsP/CotA-like multicopper oxidase with cupredoxin domain